jgi:hypothetical protein
MPFDIISALRKASHGDQKKESIESSSRCGNPALSKLIDELGVDFLIATLNLKPELFTEIYQCEPFTKVEINGMTELIISHVETCYECQEANRLHLSTENEIVSCLKSANSRSMAKC